MSEVLESYDDCPLLEKLIWDQVVKDCGDFSGIKKLDLSRLVTLKALVDARINMAISGEEAQAI